MSKFKLLKNLLKSSKPNYIMEAHNGISSQIVEKSGFKAIWASGLTLSASRGVRDANEASWSQSLDTLEAMSDVSNIPILFDGDTGYGNYNNARRLVRKLEDRQIAGICIEDKLFPKTNSFYDSSSQKLADKVEFANKITACKEYQKNEDFSVIARLESLIVGLPVDDALERAEMYVDAGADAILIHSKEKTFDEIEYFTKEFKKINSVCKNTPMVIVPTKYYSTPTQKFFDSGISNIIWANHNLRTSIKAMEDLCKTIYEEKSLVSIEDRITTVDEIFEYQKNKELSNDDKIYLSSQFLGYERKNDYYSNWLEKKTK